MSFCNSHIFHEIRLHISVMTSLDTKETSNRKHAQMLACLAR